MVVVAKPRQCMSTRSNVDDAVEYVLGYARELLRHSGQGTEGLRTEAFSNLKQKPVGTPLDRAMTWLADGRVLDLKFAKLAYCSTY